MPFKIALSPTYKSKVVVETPNEHGKGFDRSDFIAEFKRVEMDELEQLRSLPQKEVLDRVFVGFGDLLDEEDKPVEYTQATREALLKVPQARVALVEAFWSSIFKAREKN